MYTALYRTYRPETFDEILGQEHIVKILKNQIAVDSVSHAYLFCGTRGTGKTTTARILAKAVNCLSPAERPCGTCEHCRAIKEGNFMDVVEIDAASNNGVENIRELRESVKYPPAVGNKKVYIIDEVHMLSTGAFNALLKTLEEPPEYVMFILATTEPQKLPPTILSRCMRLDFRRVSQEVIGKAMEQICQGKGVTVSEDAIRLLANCSDGSVRDGLSILDQVLAGGDKTIDRDKVLEYVGTTGDEFFIDLTELVSLRKTAEALVLLNDVLREGKDVKQIMKAWVSHYRSLLITKFVRDAQDMLNMSQENLIRVSNQSKQMSLEEIDFAVTRLSKTINDARWSTNPRVLLELAIVTIGSGDDPNKDSAPKPRVAAKPVVAPPAKAPIDVATTETVVTETVVTEVATKVATNIEPTTAKVTAKVDEVTKDTDDGINKEALWHSIFDNGDDSAGSFNLIRSGTELIHLSEDSFTIVTNSSFTQKYVEQKRQQVEKLMEKQTGKPMKLICHLKEECQVHTKDENVEQIAKEAQTLLGIDIDIE